MGQRFRVGDSTFEDVQAYLFQMINGLRNALTAQTRVFTGHSLRVSLSDKLHNARAILRDFKCFGPGVWSRFSASREEVLWYYRSLVSAYRSTGAGAMVDELDLVVSEIALRCGDVPKKTNGRPVVEGPVSAGDTLRLGTMYFAIVAAPPVIDPGAA